MLNNFIAELAKENNEVRKKRFGGEINVSVECSKRYTLSEIRRNPIDVNILNRRDSGTPIDVVDSGIQYYLRVALRHTSIGDGKVAVLNPADYLRPGGTYIEGDCEYEENICSTTTLYEVLSKCNSYYDWNWEHINKGLGTNVCLYTPRVTVLDNCNNSIGEVDVISCSAPNYDTVSVSKCNKAIRDRIELVLDVAVRNEIKHLILCGFGCGCERSDIDYIAGAFRDICSVYQSRFDTIVFVMDTTKGAKVFKKTFEVPV